jgi:ribosomal protein S12 methylthiotransferase
MAERYWLETLGCPKNEVDSAKLLGTLVRAGLEPASGPDTADLVVVNTCAFIEAARQESVETILEMSRSRRAGAKLVVTGCMAERYGDELAAAMPEVDLVAGFGEALVDLSGPVGAETRAANATGAGMSVSVAAPIRRRVPAFDLLELPRPRSSSPWAYVKIAEGCDRRCAYCAIPTFRGLQRSRSAEAVLDEVESLGSEVREIVLVAQDLASWGLDRSDRSGESGSGSSGSGRVQRSVAPRPLVGLLEQVAERVERVRLLYLYPSSVDGTLIDAICATGVPYFDLSLQHVSKTLLRRMHRPGGNERFRELVGRIRAAAPEAVLRSNFILGFPGETEEDHDELLSFLEEIELDWAGFFTFSEEPGTPADGLEPAVPPELALERLRECSEIQDAVTARCRQSLVGSELSVLVDSAGIARSHREAPQIDGVVHVPTELVIGSLTQVLATDAAGPDLWARAIGLPADVPSSDVPASNEPLSGPVNLVKAS